jgi:hypothetical protein
MGRELPPLIPIAGDDLGHGDDSDRRLWYYNANIKGTGKDGPFDCRTHAKPTY